MQTAINQKSAASASPTTEPKTAGDVPHDQISKPANAPSKARKKKKQKVRQLAEIYTAAAVLEQAADAAQPADDEPAHEEASCVEPAAQTLLAAAGVEGQPPVCSAVTDADAVGLHEAEAGPPKRRRCGSVMRNLYEGYAVKSMLEVCLWQCMDVRRPTGKCLDRTLARHGL